MSRKLYALLLVMCLGLVVGCSNSDGSEGSGGSSGSVTATGPVTIKGADGSVSFVGGNQTTAGARLTGEKFLVRVLARDAVQRTAKQLAKAYKEAHPGSLVQLTIDSGDGIAERISAGETPDIILDNRKNLEAMAEEAGDAWAPKEFGTQVLAIAVDPGNPLGIQSLRVFGNDPNVKTGLCVPEKNCGQSALNLLARARVEPVVDQIFPGATGTVDGLKDGSIDATILDSTKIANRSAVAQAVRLPSSLKPATTHWLMTSLTSAPPADSFTDFMFSAAGSAVLTNRGLLPVTP